MGTGFALPTEGPWRVRLTRQTDLVGFYAVELMDPKAGGVQAGPFFLMFPSSEYAFEWFCSLATLDDHAQRPAILDAGGAVTGWAESAIWSPMISAMFHAAETKHRLASPWWYGSYANWAEVDPLLPPAVAEAQQILLDNTPEEPQEPGKQIFGIGMQEYLDHSLAPTPITSADIAEYPGPDGVVMYRVQVHCVTNDDTEFDRAEPPNTDDMDRSLTFADQLMGDIRLRMILPADEPILSRYHLGLPMDVLEELIGTIQEYESVLEECYEVDYHDPVEQLEAVIGPQGEEVFGVHYLQAVDGNVRHDYWRATGHWAEDFPTSTTPWLREAHRANDGSISDDMLDSDEFGMTIWAASTPFNVEPWAAAALLHRFDAEQQLDIVMAEIAGQPPDRPLGLSDLSAFAQTILARNYAGLRNPHIDHHLQAPMLAAFVYRSGQLPSMALLSAYMWLVDGLTNRS